MDKVYQVFFACFGGRHIERIIFSDIAIIKLSFSPLEIQKNVFPIHFETSRNYGMILFLKFSLVIS